MCIRDSFNVNQLMEDVSSQKGSMNGSLSLAMIPTVAPYLLPAFISVFQKNFPDVNLKITEMRTESIIRSLHSAEIDMAIPVSYTHLDVSKRQPYILHS